MEYIKRLIVCLLAITMVLNYISYPIHAIEDTQQTENDKTQTKDESSIPLEEEIEEPSNTKTSSDEQVETKDQNKPEAKANEESSVISSKTIEQVPSTIVETNNAGSFNITGGTSGIEWIYDSTVRTLTFNTSGDYTVTGTGDATTDNIVVTNGFTGTITIKNVDIDVSNENKAAIELQGNANVKLVLEETNTLKSAKDYAGIQVQETETGNASLEITGDGNLNVSGGENGAGIGGNDSYSNGMITISNGTIQAYGGYLAAGIGGGNRGNGHNIYMKGGNIIAQGGDTGAGIGGGYGSTGEDIYIEGGTITAYGGIYAKSIGAGNNGHTSNIVIKGGSVKADSIGITPTDGNGKEVYLAKINNMSGIGAILIDGYNTFKRKGNHQNNDGTFYAYLTGDKKHAIKVNDERGYFATLDNNEFTVKEASVPPEFSESDLTQTVTANSITVELKTDSIYGSPEYSIDEGKTWQNSGAFEKLLNDTEYTILAKTSGTDRYICSNAVSIKVKTKELLGDLTVKTDKKHGDDWYYNDKENVLYFYKDGEYTVIGNSKQTEECIVVANGFKGTITIENVNIWRHMLAAIDLQGNANVKLILKGTNKLESYNYPGISVAAKSNDNVSSIEITGDGSLVATGGDWSSGIGAKVNNSSGYITISGGNLYVKGGAHAVSIGAGAGKTVANLITINGGTVTALSTKDIYKIDSIGSTIDGETKGIIINGGSIKADGMSVQPKDSQGNNVYLAKINNLDGVDTITVDGKNTYNRNGNHTDDRSFYVYLTGENHEIKTAKGNYQAIWNKDNQTFSVKAYPPTPTITIDSSKTTANRIVVDKLENTDKYGGVEYSIDNEETWQDSNVFSGLESGKKYTIYARYKGNDDYFVSNSFSITVSTKMKSSFVVISDTTHNDFEYDAIKNSLIFKENGTGTYTVTGDGKATCENISISNGFKGTITIKNINIDASIDDRSAIELNGNADVKLVLEGTNTLKGANNYAGIQVQQTETANASIEIDGDGNLNVYGGDYGAGIGGGNKFSNGMITISNGTIQAYGGYSAAGIGGGAGGNGYDIRIEGGNLISYGGANGAGIGGGVFSDGYDIYIEGGSVTARGDVYDIGGGTSGNTKNIVIKGGSVKADHIGSTPTDGNGKNVYLAKIDNMSGIDTILIDGYKIIEREGDHYDNDGTFYVYLSNEKNHGIKVGDNGYIATFNNDKFDVKEAVSPIPSEDNLTKTSTGDSVTVTLNDTNIYGDAEYSIDEGKTWQDTGTFHNLLNDKEYTIFARYKGNDTYVFSDSLSTSIKTTPMTGDLTVETHKAHGKDWYYNNLENTLYLYKTGDYTITGTSSETNENIVVANEFKGTITIENVNINCEQPAIELRGVANVKLHLKGKNILKSKQNQGIKVVNEYDKQASIEITGEGSLAAYAGKSNAGIGGSVSTASGFITISGGNVYAQGEQAVGIGSDSLEVAGTITINGGTVTAVGSGNGVSIRGKAIIINGGSIKADGMSVQPKETHGNNVYLVKIDGLNDVNTITVDSKEYLRTGNHSSDDSSFYVYLTGEDHEIKTTKGNYRAIWNKNDQTFTMMPYAPKPIITIDSSKTTASSITINALENQNKYGPAEYSLDGENWVQNSQQFIDLKSSTLYTVYARYTGNDNYAESEVATAIVSTASASYTITIPSEPLKAGKEGSQAIIKSENLDIGYIDQVAVKVKNDSNMTNDGKLILKRKDDLDTGIHSSLLVDEKPFTDISKNIVTFTLNNQNGVSISFTKPTESNIPAGTYSGVVTFEISLVKAVKQ